MPDFPNEIGAAEAAQKLRAAEHMLERYIQVGKKPLAELALATLLELAPQHPRRDEYRQWVAEIDQEVANQAKVERAIADVRSAVASGDSEIIRDAVERLERLDADAAASISGELAEIERQRANDTTIETFKRRIEQLLAKGDVNSAENEIEGLAEMVVPKVTLDFLRRRLADRRSELRSRAELQSLESVFEQHLRQRRWHSARDVARVVVEQFDEAEIASRLLATVDQHEASERRRRSIDQGLATLERFLETGQLQQAELALRVLRGLDVPESQLEPYRQRLAML